MSGRPGARILVIANDYLPDCKVHGSATLLANLLRHFDPEEYVLMRGPFVAGEDTVPTPDLAHRSSVMPFPPRAWRGKRLLRPLQVVLLILQGLWLVWKFRPRVILVNFPYEHNMVAAYYVSRLTGILLHVFMHDLWEENAAPPDRLLARRYEGKILRHACRVYAITYRARDHYVAKYDLRDVKVLLHAADQRLRKHVGERVTDPTVLSALRGDTATVVFAGGIYWMNQDAFANLVCALNRHGRGKVKLILLTDRSRALLEKNGLWYEETVLAKVNRSELLRICARADVLFLPLSFTSGQFVQEIKTVFPTKCLEYYLAGKPILCNAPPHSYVAEAIKEKHWAHLVEYLDPDLLWEGLQKVLTDRDYAGELARNAARCAEERDSQRVANQLHQWLSGA